MKQFIFLILLFIIFGCNRSKDIGCDNFFSVLRKAPSVNVSKENLPEWLVARINDYYETWTPLSCNVYIYKGKWKKHTVYFISDSFSSCLFCNVYYEDGENIIWPPDGKISDNFCSTSKDWKLIYKYGEGPFMI